MEGYPTYPVGPLIEPVGFGAPLVPAPAPEPLPFAVQQPEPLELSTPADEDSWRYSRFALPWLLTCLGWLFAVFCLTFWQQSGDVKRLYDGVPRLIELHSAAQSKYEGGLPKSLRNLRIATGWFGFFGVLIALGVFLARPKRNIRVALNFLCVALLAVSAVIAWIEFGIALGKYSTLVHCPDMNRWTLQKCTPRVAYETVAIALDAAVGVSTIVALLLLAYNTQKNHWKLAPRDWDEAIEDTQERPKERAPGEKAMRNVSFVRKWLTGLALLFCLATLIALQVFVVILHEQRQKEFLYGERGRTDSSLDAHSRKVFEHAGWATVNTRIRYSAVGIGIVSVLLNFLPFRAKIIALVFAFIYFATGVILLVGFGFDLYELRISRGCGASVDGLELDCNRGSFISTVIIEFLAAFWLFIYLLVEYVLLKRRQCQHCERAYEMPDLIKHETADCPARPVRCEVCAKSMSFKEFDAHKSACSVDHVRCKGCNTVVPKWGFKGHQEECPRCSVRCTMCEEAFQRCDMPHHVMVCPNRPASCDACGETFRTRDMDAHRAVCGEVLVQCELCQDFMQRFRLQQHDQHHCPKRLVRCSRCHQEVPRFRWERHVQRECAL